MSLLTAVIFADTNVWLYNLRMSNCILRIDVLLILIISMNKFSIVLVVLCSIVVTVFFKSRMYKLLGTLSINIAL